MKGSSQEPPADAHITPDTGILALIRTAQRVVLSYLEDSLLSYEIESPPGRIADWTVRSRKMASLHGLERTDNFLYLSEKAFDI